MGSGQNTALYTHSTQECVEEIHKTTTIQENYEWYHGQGKGMYQMMTGTTKIITLRRCSSHIDRTSGYGKNMNYQIIVII